MVYVYPTLIDPSKLWDQLKRLKDIASSHNIDSVVAIGADTPEDKQNFVNDIVTLIVEGNSLGEPSIRLNVLQALQFTLLYAGIRGV